MTLLTALVLTLIILCDVLFFEASEVLRISELTIFFISKTQVQLAGQDADIR